MKRRISNWIGFVLCFIILSGIIYLYRKSYISHEDNISTKVNEDYIEETTVSEKNIETDSEKATTNHEDQKNENHEEDSDQELDNNEESIEDYSYINPDGMTMKTRIHPPKGYNRINDEEGSLLNFVRNLELKPDGSSVLLYDGRNKGNQSAQVAVFALDVGKKDLQQCADSVMRVYAEYYWSIGAYNKIKFHLTNGFLMDYETWRNGNRIKVEGNKVTWVNSYNYDDSYESFREYLTYVMIYAGTLSLSNESSDITIQEIQPGDMLLKGGSPGHCVLFVDIAENKKGEKCYLLAQGYMPAQDFHILKNPKREDCPWYFEEDLQGAILTPEYQFDEINLKRWNKGL